MKKAVKCGSGETEPGTIGRQEEREIDDRRKSAMEGVEQKLDGDGGGGEVVLENAVQGSPAVSYANLLALRVGPAAVGDAHFVDPKAHLGDLRHQLRLDAEPSSSIEILWMISRRKTL